ncbi:MAG: 2'-5' RNA ligase family protein [Beutenbergiaceae bacterium]
MRVPSYTENQILIGLTISIPPPYDQPLSRARLDSGDSDAMAIVPHITLLPPIPVERSQLEQVHAHLRHVAAQHAPFVMTLSGTGTFRPISPTVFVIPEQGAQQCVRLHQAINRGVLAQQTRFPYRPHVTIAHDVSEAKLDAAAAGLVDFHASFPVAAFACYELCADQMWRESALFQLTGKLGPGSPGR